MSVISNLISQFSSSKPTSPPLPTGKALPKDGNYYYHYSRMERRVSGYTQPQVGLMPTNYGANNTVFSLTDFDVNVEMTEAASISVYTQRYKNGSTTPVEAVYKLPLPPFAALSRLVITYQDKVLEGIVKEKQEALDTYSDAISNGGQAFLAEKQDDGFFAISIGNLPPGDEVTVSITIVSEVGTHLEDLHYCLHRFMFPSYPFNFSLQLKVNLTTRILGINLDNYQHKTEIDGKSATLTLTKGQRPTQNIIVEITPENDYSRPSYFIETVTGTDDKPTSSAMAINFYPQFKDLQPEDIDQRSEIIYLLDCSGSMSGGSIKSARSALQLLMRSLTENCKFNIYLFGSSYKSLFPESVEYNDETLAKASHFIQTIDANLGGTELLQPVKAILGLPYDEKYPRQLFILTDGEISSRDEMIDFVGKESSTTRIFTLGIGGSVDRELVIGLSKSCMGYYGFIQQNNEMEVEVMKLLSIAMEPTVSNIKVDWGELDVIQAPKVIRPIFNHERMMIYALLNKLPSQSHCPIKITCDGPQGVELSFDIDADFTNAKRDGGNSLHTLTAFEIIKDLESEERKQPNKNKDKIIELGKKYQLVSNHTSFVVTSDSDKVTQETMTKVNVMPPQQQLLQPRPQQHLQPSRRMMAGGPPPAPGGGGSFQRLMSSPAPPTSSTGFGALKKLSAPTASPANFDSLCVMAPPPPPAPVSQYQMAPPPPPPVSQYPMAPPPSGSSAPYPTPTSSSSYYINAPTSSSSFSYGSTQTVVALESTDPLHKLLKLQKANGSWTDADVKKSGLVSVPNAPSELTALLDVWTTLAIIAHIKKQYATRKAEWDLVLIKATKYAKSQLTKANLKYDQIIGQYFSS